MYLHSPSNLPPMLSGVVEAQCCDEVTKAVPVQQCKEEWREYYEIGIPTVFVSKSGAVLLMVVHGVFTHTEYASLCGSMATLHESGSEVKRSDSKVVPGNTMVMWANGVTGRYANNRKGTDVEDTNRKASIILRLMLR